MCEGVEIGALGQVLTDESIGVLVEPTLPGMVGVGEVALGVESLGNGLIVMVLVRTYMLVDPFMTDMQSLLPRQPAADLLRTPVLTQQALNPLPGSGGNPRTDL